MHKIWHWIKSKKLINKRTDDENKFVEKRKWHSYIFTSIRKKNSKKNSFVDNFDQIATTSTSMPLITPSQTREEPNDPGISAHNRLAFDNLEGTE